MTALELGSFLALLPANLLALAPAGMDLPLRMEMLTLRRSIALGRQTFLSRAVSTSTWTAARQGLSSCTPLIHHAGMTGSARRERSGPTLRGDRSEAQL